MGKEKDTSDLLKALENCEEFGRFYEENKEVFTDKPLYEELYALQERSGLKKNEVIRLAQLSDIYGYKIFEGQRKPERKKLLCLLIALRATFAETQRILKTHGYAMLYAKDPADCVVIYGICNNMNVMQINGLLFEYGFEMI